MNEADLKIMLFTGLMWVSFVSFIISALIVRQIEATLNTGIVMILSIIAIHEYRIKKLENEVEENE